MSLWFHLAAGFCAIACVAPEIAIARPNFVDLSATQTPIRNQGAQGSCIVFAATAALEAAYNRAGYGQIDLSEALVNHFGKMMWIEPNWQRTVSKGEDGPELKESAPTAAEAAFSISRKWPTACGQPSRPQCRMVPADFRERSAAPCEPVVFAVLDTAAG